MNTLREYVEQVFADRLTGNALAESMSPAESKENATDGFRNVHADFRENGPGDWDKSDSGSNGHTMYQGNDGGSIAFTGKVGDHHHYTELEHDHDDYPIPQKKYIDQQVRLHNPHLPPSVHKHVVNDMHAHVTS